MTIFIGNLSWETEEEDLRYLFKTYGEVTKCTIPLDRDSGRKRGFGFVEMTSETLRKMRLMIYKMSSGWVEKLELSRRRKKIAPEEIVDIMAVKVIFKQLFSF